VKAGSEKKTIWSYYENDSSIDSSYGKLYNWYAVNDPRGIAPEGYHIPSNDEWNTLIVFLGTSDFAVLMLKSTSGWEKDGNGSENDGFLGLPGGLRMADGSFDQFGSLSYWWSSSSINEFTASFSYLNFENNKVFSFNFLKIYRLSIRCIKD